MRSSYGAFAPGTSSVLKSLNQLRRLRNAIVGLRIMWLRRMRGIVISDSATLSLSSRLLSATHGSIVIGDRTLVAFKTLLFTRDPVSGHVRPIHIGRHCFIGGGSTILPGVTIGEGSIVGAGSVVMEDVPSHVIVGGNPARILRSDISVGPYGRLAGADENTRRLWK